MNNFESIFIPFDNSQRRTTLPQVDLMRFKMGEIFRCGKVYALVCIHCSVEFTDFCTFDEHAQLHLNQVSVGSKYKTEFDINGETIGDESTVDMDVQRFNANTSNTIGNGSMSEKNEDNDSTDNGIEFENECSNDSEENGETSQCPLCIKTFNTIDALRTHLHAAHNKNYPAGVIESAQNKQQKTDAGKLLRSKFSSLSEKERYLSVQKKLRGECVKLDNSLEAIYFFKYIHDYDGINTNNLQCPKCSYKCEQLNKLKTHIFKHVEGKIFVCTVCKRNFNSIGAIRIHVKRMHRQILMKKCRTIESNNINAKNDDKASAEVETNMSSVQSASEINDTSTATSPERCSTRKTRRSKPIQFQPSSEISELSASDNDSNYEPRKSSKCNESIVIDDVSDISIDEDETEITLTPDDFQQHSKVQAKFRQKYIDISDTPVAIEYAKYALMSDFKRRENSFECPKCPQLCTKAIEMRRHIFTHLKQEIFTCMVCNRRSNRLSTITWHVSEHGKKNSKKVFQQLAAKIKYKSNDDEQIESDASNGEMDKQYLKVKTKLNMNCMDLENSPDGIKFAKYFLLYGLKVTDGQYECPHCHLRISVRNSLRKHLFRHIKAEIFSCLVCGEKSDAYDLMRKHMKQRHSNLFNNLDANIEAEEDATILFDNITDNNQRQINVLCSICGTSVRARGLQKHMVTHTRTAAFTCEFCDKTFTRKCKHLEHRRLHPEPMPYHCNICNKGYILKKGLMRHLPTHVKAT